MNINFIAMGILALILGGYAWKAYMAPVDTPMSNFLPFVPIDVRKNKVYVSQTRDAGMFIERQRRTAIIRNPNLKPSYMGSTNGSMEWNFLSGICVCPDRLIRCPAEPEAVIWDANGADPEICDIVDAGGAFGGYDVIDAGGAAGNVCEV